MFSAAAAACDLLRPGGDVHGGGYVSLDDCSIDVIVGGPASCCLTPQLTRWRGWDHLWRQFDLRAGPGLPHRQGERVQLDSRITSWRGRDDGMDDGLVQMPQRHVGLGRGALDDAQARTTWRGCFPPRSFEDCPKKRVRNWRATRSNAGWRRDFNQVRKRIELFEEWESWSHVLRVSDKSNKVIVFAKENSRTKPTYEHRSGEFGQGRREHARSSTAHTRLGRGRYNHGGWCLLASLARLKPELHSGDEKGGQGAERRGVLLLGGGGAMCSGAGSFLKVRVSSK